MGESLKYFCSARVAELLEEMYAQRKIFGLRVAT